MTPSEHIIPNRRICEWLTYLQALARINKLRKFYKFIVLTLDAPLPGKREADERLQGR